MQQFAKEGGAIFSPDGTYTISSRFAASIQKVMYTGYKKFHGWKLLVCASLNREAILWLKVLLLSLSISEIVR